jgi:hypothetical protein
MTWASSLTWLLTGDRMGNLKDIPSGYAAVNKHLFRSFNSKDVTIFSLS